MSILTSCVQILLQLSSSLSSRPLILYEAHFTSTLFSWGLCPSLPCYIIAFQSIFENQQSECRQSLPSALHTNRTAVARLVSNAVCRRQSFTCRSKSPDRDLITSSSPSQPSKCPSFSPCAQHPTARGAGPPPLPPHSPQYQKIAMLPSQIHGLPLRSPFEDRIVPHINTSPWVRRRDTVIIVRLRTTLPRSVKRERDRMPRNWLRRGRSC